MTNELHTWANHYNDLVARQIAGRWTRDIERQDFGCIRDTSVCFWRICHGF